MQFCCSIVLKSQKHIFLFFANGDEQLQALKTARHAGQQAAHHGQNPCEIEDLMKRNNYTHEQVVAYLEVFDKTVGDEQNQVLRKARCVAQQAARHGQNRPEIEALMTDGYTQEQAATYLKYFDKSIEEEQVKAFNKEVMECAKQNIDERLLVDKSPKFLNQFKEAKGQIEKAKDKKKLKRVEKAGFMLGSKKVAQDCYTPEYLAEKRGYNQSEIDAYITGYHKGREQRQKKHPLGRFSRPKM